MEWGMMDGIFAYDEVAPHTHTLAEHLWKCAKYVRALKLRGACKNELPCKQRVMGNLLHSTAKQRMATEKTDNYMGVGSS